MLPKNLPLVMDNTSVSHIIDECLRNADDTFIVLTTITRAYPVIIKFKKPMVFNGKEKTQHHFGTFFLSSHNNICYGHRMHAYTGYPLPKDFLSNIQEMSLDINSVDFKDFQEFINRFHPDFITRKELKNLWNDPHGVYNKRNFRALNDKALNVLKDFKKKFKGLNNTDHYKGDFLTCRSWRTYDPRSKNVTISHSKKAEFINISLERAGTCNGSYGLIANNREYLHLEDD